jgi:hypothetical protein
VFVQLKNGRKGLTFTSSFSGFSVFDFIRAKNKENYYLRYRNEEKTHKIPLQKYFVPISRQGFLVFPVDSYKWFAKYRDSK